MTKDTGKPKAIDINELLDTFNLGSTFDKTILKRVLALKMPRGSEAEIFVFSKLNDLKSHVSAHKKDDTTDEELKTLISDWLADQGDIDPAP